MRKLIVQELVTVDGYFAGPNGEIDWHNVDEEYGEYASRFLSGLDMLLFGRKTYQLLADYWPTAEGDFARRMNTIDKVVFSTTLTNADWPNTRLVAEHAIEEIKRLKDQPGKDLAVLGSGELVGYLLSAGLIDEVQLTVIPVVLGKGKPLFGEGLARVQMQLVESNTMKSGNVMLVYRPESL
ncbi:dihydrofolate reductase family protein [Paenibacillus koleovorans]|uniref:dihydrofolate reductase family protein n=1 Tax=Paenibacillus koleovorans TaxID=121608 RepID=UPI000FD7A5B6|nr:dihydrofolate reductase family protein [Paenibacillus koleovorans]